MSFRLRHPILRVLQLICSVVSALLVFLGARTAPPLAPSTAFTVSAVGEREASDGSWTGVDALLTPEESLERIQLHLRVMNPGRVVLDVNEKGSLTRVFPLGGDSGVVRPGTEYALPGPAAFYDVEGDATLVLTVEPLHGNGEESETARPAGGSTRVDARLTDGSAFPVAVRAFRGHGRVVLEIPVRGSRR